MKITFVGAAREVTGSCYLVETSQVRFLVDCGMHQGARPAEQRNRHPFPFDVRAVDFVLLTHAHIDHSGLLPKLKLDGYAGPIHATAATNDLLRVMLPDSGHLQEVEAEHAAYHRSRHGNSHDQDPEATIPLYTVQDALACLGQMRAVEYDKPFSPGAGVRCTFRDAGHILGSSIIEIWLSDGGQQRKLVFSGDLGQPGRPILRDPELIADADVVLVESTYGNRAHRNLAATLDELVGAVNHTLHEKNGNVIVPAFAVGRTQELIYYFVRLTREHRLHGLNVYVDSPMATAATQITMRHMELFDQEAKEVLGHRSGDSPKLHFTESVQESKALNDIRSGAIIISAGGMCEGGRIRHHLRYNIGSPQNTILITGFQAQGTLGRRLVDGAKSIHLFGTEIPVRAEIFTLGGFSAHADQPALLHWLRGFRKPPRQTFIVHGEEEIALEFARTVGTQLGWPVHVPSVGESIEI